MFLPALCLVPDFPFWFWLFASVVWNCWDLVIGDAQGAHGKSLGLIERLGHIRWNEKLYLFGAAAWLLILASNMKISHQFSSRYVVVQLHFF